MTIIKERTEIARAMNFGKYPVITMDVAKSTESFGEIYEGTNVKIYDEEIGCYVYANTCYFGDSKKIEFLEGSITLHSSFGYSDIMKMVEHAHSVELKSEQEVIIIFTNKENGKCSFPILTKTTKFNPQHSDVMRLEGDFEDIIKALK